jgi:hypothetical protein
MYALITQNNEIAEIGELRTLFPNEPVPTHLYGIQHGARPIVEGHQENQQFYFVTFDKYEVGADSVTRTYVNTPRILEDRLEVNQDNTPMYVKIWDATANGGQGAMVDTTEQMVTKGLKSQYKTQFKQTANSMLAQTDWMVIRKVERNVAIPADVATKRAAILTECDRLIAAVTAASDMTAFITAVNSANWN